MIFLCIINVLVSVMYCVINYW